MNEQKILEATRMFLEAIGEDPDREGLKDTPERVARMAKEIFAGFEADPGEILSKRFSVDSKDPVLERDIPFYSLCEHHLLPFFGKVHIAYIPNGEVVGISKLARTVEVYARRPQIQERMTSEIADTLMRELNPKGVMVYVEAEHMCMSMRGVKKPGAKTVTTAARGEYENEDKRRAFFDLLGSRA